MNVSGALPISGGSGGRLIDRPARRVAPMTRSLRRVAGASLIGAMLLGMIAVVPASAASPTGVTIVSPMTFNPDGFNFGTFEASGPAVDAGLICESGTVDDTRIIFAGFQSNRGAQIPVRKTFTCDDGGDLHQDPGPPRLPDLDRVVHVGRPRRDRRLRRRPRQRRGHDLARRLRSADRQHQHVHGLPPALSPRRSAPDTVRARPPYFADRDREGGGGAHGARRRASGPGSARSRSSGDCRSSRGSSRRCG